MKGIRPSSQRRCSRSNPTVASVVLVVLGAALLLAGGVTYYLRTQILDQDAFADRAVAALDQVPKTSRGYPENARWTSLRSTTRGRRRRCAGRARRPPGTARRSTPTRPAFSAKPSSSMISIVVSAARSSPWSPAH